MFEVDDGAHLSCSLHSPIGEQPLLSLLALENGAIILGGRHLLAGNWRSGHIQQKQMDLPSTLKRCCYYIEGEENFSILYLAFLHFVFYISSFVFLNSTYRSCYFNLESVPCIIK